MLLDGRQNFFLGLVELELPVDRAGRNEDMALRELGILQGFIAGIDIRLDRASQARHCGLCHHFGNSLNRRKRIRTGRWKASLDGRDSPFF